MADVENALNSEVEGKKGSIKHFKTQISQASGPKERGGAFADLVSGCCSGVSAIIMTILFNIVPILMIYVGNKNMQNCTIKSEIPLWLVIMGALSIVQAAFKLLKTCIIALGGDEKNQGISNVSSIFGLLSFICFCFGVYYVYSVYSDVSYDPILGGANYCDIWTYRLAFWNITLAFIFFGFFILFLCCGCCCAIFLGGK